MALSTPRSWIRSAGKQIAMYGARRAGEYVGGAIRKKLFNTTPKKSNKRKSNKKKRSKIPSAIVEASPGGYTYSSFKKFMKGKPMPRFMKSFLPARVDRDVSGDIITTEGEHNVQGCSYYSWADKATFTRPIDILDDSAIPTVKAYIKQVKGSLEIANQTNTSCQIICYDVVARRDLQGTDAAGDADTPLLSWDEVDQTGGAVIIDEKSYLNYGATPFDSPEFCQKFKVVRVTRVSLTPGNTHVHNVTLNLNWMLNKEYQQAYNGYRGKTHYTIVVARGMPMAKLITSGLVDSTVTAPIELHVIKTRAVTYRGINSQQSYYQYNNALSYDGVAGTYATMSFDVEKNAFESA